MQLLPDGAPLPLNIVDPIYSRRTKDATEVYLAGTELAPYSFEQTEDSLTLRLYTTESDVGSMVFAQPDPTLKGLRWFQERDGVMKVVMTFKRRQQWGYTAEYVGTTLKIRLRDQPKDINALRPLVGRSITIDAGHGGEDTGGAGPLRVPEKDLVLQISLKLAAYLREQGARVVMTRTTDTEIDLFERSLIADREQTEVFLSIHANAIPDGANPADFKGAGAYYFHPQARALAEFTLQGMARAVPEMGNDGVHYQNLAVTRTQAQPQVLLELGFLTDKSNLRLMTSSAGQQRIIAGIATGLAQFYREQTRR